MSRYPDETTRRFDQQFAESPDERNERVRNARSRRVLETHWRLIADLSAWLTDEGNDVTPEGLHAIRRRVANALPPEGCPEWLERYRDPPVIGSATP